MPNPATPRLPYRVVYIAYAAVVFGVGAVILLLLSAAVRQQVLAQAQREAPLVAQVLAADFARHVNRNGLSTQDLRRVYQQLDRLYRRRAQAQGVAWLKVYAADGRILYSPDMEEVGLRREEDAASVARALHGPPIVLLIETEQEPDLAGRGLPPWLVEVYVPLPPESEPFRVFEVYLDVTPYLAQGRQTQWRIAGVLFVGAVVLFGLLVFITRRAYRVIEAQMAALAEANAALQRLEAHKRGLINMVVHDLKNLLGVMLGHAELLALQEAQDERHTWAEEILQAGRQMQEMIHNLLDLSRLEERAFPVQLQPLLVAEVVAEASAPFCRWAQEHGKTCRVTLDERASLALADAQLLRRVVQNLVSNAVHHARGQVEVRVEAVEDGVAVAVADDGEGIPPEHLPHIFEPYYRVPGTRRRGMGLGLAFCQQAVQAMGGRLTVESRVGEGTIFRFTLLVPGEGGEAAAGGS